MFLPITKKELKNTDKLDFICVTGDAYVDHPSFGVAIISRMIEHLGFSVGIIAQPVKDAEFCEFGEPRYAFMVTGGNIDSMVSNYTVSRKKRHNDEYSPGGKGGRRPDYAVNAYCGAIKRLFPWSNIVIGGLEASLRRFAHYDYWSDKVLPSVLVSSGADLLLYGMSERSLTQLLERLRGGEKLTEIKDIRGTCYLADKNEVFQNSVSCGSFDEVREDKKIYAEACRIQYDEQDEIYGKTITQRHGDKLLVQNPPPRSLTRSEMDLVYELPYEKASHPSYEKTGGVPGIREVEFSITHNRGCFGFCNFCSIALHQGRKIQTRSEESVVREAERLTEKPNFKGYIHDVGGPTANFRSPSCKKQLKAGLCKGKKCFECPNLEAGHEEYLRLLRRLRGIKKVKKVFVRSGLRYDYILRDKSGEFLRELIAHHVSGQLKVAPEHSSPAVLDLMGKPRVTVYEEFEKRFYDETKKCGLEQYLVPYFMSSHPGSTISDAVNLAVFLKKHNIRPEQVQDFYPTPGTISTAMYHTGLDPYTMKSVYVPKKPEEKALQRALLQYYKPENRDAVRKALIIAGRQDLIGDYRHCLVPAERGAKSGGVKNGTKSFRQIEKGNKPKYGQKGKKKK